MAFAVVVTFQIKPDQFNDFMALMRTNAQTSVMHEDGCLQFDVATDPSRPSEVFLYEIYTSEDAFQAHLNSEHFATFDQATTQMITTKDIKTFVDVIR